jgi:outer membrane protein, adhesin transport system
LARVLIILTTLDQPKTEQTLIHRYSLKLLLVLNTLYFSQVSSALTVEEAVSQALRTNPELMAAKNASASREYESRQARAAYLPQLSVSAGVGRETRNAPSTGFDEVDLNRRELGLQASQLVFDGFATPSEINRQHAREQSAHFAMLATAESLALRVSEAYINVLRHAKLLDLTRDTLWEHKNIYDQMKLRSDKGVGSKADLDQIAARLALANANVIVAENNLADAQSAYHRLTGVYPGIESMQEPSLPEGLPASSDIAIKDALDKHPTLKSASADVDAAVAQQHAAKSTLWPNLRLEADKRWDENVGGIEGEDEDFVVALRMRYDLYSGGANKALRQQMAYLNEEAKSIRNNTHRQVVESMQLSWNAFEALTQQQTFLQQHVDAATETKSAYAKQFDIGRRTLLDLLNTETEVVEAKRSLINAQYDRTYAGYRIFNAAGSLLNAMQIQLVE